MNRQSFTVYLRNFKRNIGVCKTKSRLFVFLAKMVHHNTQSASDVILVLQSIAICKKSIWVSKPNCHCSLIISRSRQLRAFFCVPAMSLQFHKHVLYIEVSVHMNLLINNCQLRAYTRLRVHVLYIKCFCFFMFIVLPFVNQIANNIHVIWSSCHRVCIR